MASNEHAQGGTGERINSLKQLVVDYTKQETVDPMKSLGRTLGFGIGGGVAIGLGVFLLMLAALRGLQNISALNDTGEVHGGTWSWVPYLGALAVLLVVIGACVAAAKRSSDRR